MALTVDEYLAQFPEGIDAHPSYVVKTSIIREAAAEFSVEKLQANVGEHLDVAEVLSRPSSSWLSEVHFTAVYLACRHVGFESDDAFVADAYQKSRTILTSPLYRGLGFLFTKERILKLGTRAFGMLHRGVELKLVSISPRIEDGGVWHLISPPNLVPPVFVRCCAVTILCATELAGLTDLVIDTATISPTVKRIALTPKASNDAML